MSGLAKVIDFQESTILDILGLAHQYGFEELEAATIGSNLLWIVRKALEGTVVEYSQKSRRKYRAVCSSAHSFASTAYSFAFCALLALLVRSAALTRLLAHSLAPKMMCCEM